MKFYKLIENGVITQIGSGSAVHEIQTEITQAEYDALMEAIQNRPEDTFESVFYLAEIGEYVGRERTEEEVIQWYVQVVMSGEMDITEVPEEYQEAVQAQMPTEEPVVDQYQAGYDAAVLDMINAGLL